MHTAGADGVARLLDHRLAPIFGAGSDFEAQSGSFEIDFDDDRLHYAGRGVLQNSVLDAGTESFYLIALPVEVIFESDFRVEQSRNERKDDEVFFYISCSVALNHIVVDNIHFQQPNSSAKKWLFPLNGKSRILNLIHQRVLSETGVRSSFSR